MNMKKTQAVLDAIRDLSALQGAEHGPRAVLAGNVEVSYDYSKSYDESYLACQACAVPLSVLEKAARLAGAIKEAGSESPLRTVSMDAVALGCDHKSWEINAEVPAIFLELDPELPCPVAKGEVPSEHEDFHPFGNGIGDNCAAMLEGHPGAPETHDDHQSLRGWALTVDAEGLDLGWTIRVDEVVDDRMRIPLSEINSILDFCRRPAPEEDESSMPRP